jgi:hypothetical protein
MMDSRANKKYKDSVFTKLCKDKKILTHLSQ